MSFVQFRASRSRRAFVGVSFDRSRSAWTVIEATSSQTGCYLTQEDVLSIVPETSEDDGMLTASGLQSTEYDAVTGSDCTPALTRGTWTVIEGRCVPFRKRWGCARSVTTPSGDTRSPAKL